MRQGPNGRRPRGRHHGNGGGNGGGGNGGGSGNGNSRPDLNSSRPRSAASLRHQSFDSNCGDLRVRGNAWQVYEKYQALARDATSAGDRVSAENYLQHAEHYFRIIGVINEATAVEQNQRGPAAPGFDQQPQVPQNYYGSPASMPQPPIEQPGGNVAAPASETQLQGQGEATVQTRNPQPSPFFTQEEIDEHRGEPPMAATR